MDIFETKIRGFHAKAIENIMSRTMGRLRIDNNDRSPSKTDNISTYLRKVHLTSISLRSTARTSTWPSA